MLVGAPTVAAVWANKFVPGLLDRYLGKTGYKSQQTQEPDDPEHPSNLWEPVSGDHGAHGRFDERSHALSPQLWANTHRGWLLAAGAAAAAGATWIWRRA